MLETQRHIYEQLQDLMGRLALVGLVVTGLVVALIALLGAG